MNYARMQMPFITTIIPYKHETIKTPIMLRNCFGLHTLAPWECTKPLKCLISNYFAGTFTEDFIAFHS